MTNQLRSPLRSSLRSPFEHRRGGWSPLALFSSGEQGVWYDPSDMSTLFQDSVGTIPVTAANQPVGLALDVHIGATVNIVASDFVKISGDGVVTIIGNTITITGATTQTDVRTDLFKGYATADVTCTVAGSTGAAIYAGGSPNSLTNGHNVINGYNQAAPQLNLIRVVTGTISVTINSWTCLSGNHANQPTAGKRPLTQGSPIKIDFDGVDDNLVTTFASSLGSACTVARSIPSTGASILTAQTVGTTFTNSTDSHALVIVDRALTGPETAQLTAWLNKRAGL